MTDPLDPTSAADFPAWWRDIIARWIGDVDHHEFPAIASLSRSVLLQLQPITLVTNIAVLTAPNEWAKRETEDKLKDHIESVLSSQLNKDIIISLSVREDPEPVPRLDEAAAHPPTTPRPSQAESASHTGRTPESTTESAETSPADHSPQTPPNPQVARTPQSSPPADTPAPGQRSTTSDNAVADQFAAEISSPDHPRWRRFDENKTRGHVNASSPGGRSVVPNPALMQPIPGTQPGNHTGAHTGAQTDQNIGQNIGSALDPLGNQPENSTLLNKKYTFDNFVIGSSNQLAHAACRAVAETPAHGYNPLFIWGGSGLGKTHLLHAISHYTKELQPDRRVRYISSEELTNDFINSIAADKREDFKARYRYLDMLIVDDIQFLQGKESTQEEFFHTFNALYEANKQIVLSSDRPPSQLTTLEDRLRTRFEGGLITDIQTPDLETRMAILSKKAQADGTVLPEDVLELIASRYENSIRELEGALIRVTAYCSLGREPITKQAAEAALRDIMPVGQNVTITPQMIIDVVSDYFDLTVDELVGKGRTKRFVTARQLAMYLCRELTDLSLPKLGAAFGGRDHTTVMHAERRIRETLAEDRETFNQVQELAQRVKSSARA